MSAQAVIDSVMQRRVLATCFVATTFEGYDLQSMGLAAPLLAKVMMLDKAQIGLALTATMLGLMIGATLGGWLGDRMGRPQVLATGCALFGLGTLLTAVSWDLPSLVMFRAITGIGIGAALPNVMAILAAITPREKLASQGTAIYVGFPVGAIVAAMLMPAVPALGWQSIFVIGGIPPLLIAPLVWRHMPHTTRREPSAAAAPLSSLFASGRAVTTLALWCSISAVLLLLYLYLNWLPTIAVDRGFSANFGAGVGAAFNLGSIAGALGLGRLTDRYGLRWPALLAAAMLAGGTAWLAYAATGAELLVIATINGACVIGVQFVLYALAPGYYPESLRGVGSGAAVAAGRLGSILGPYGFGLLLASGASNERAVLMILPFVGLAILCLAVLAGRPLAHATRRVAGSGE